MKKLSVFFFLLISNNSIANNLIVYVVETPMDEESNLYEMLNPKDGLKSKQRPTST